MLILDYVKLILMLLLTRAIFFYYRGHLAYSGSALGCPNFLQYISNSRGPISD